MYDGADWSGFFATLWPRGRYVSKGPASTASRVVSEENSSGGAR